MEVLRCSVLNTVEIRNGIAFDFYPGLPHMSFIVLGLSVIIDTHLD